MKEQSHKSEMRAALRGDFERLQARRRDTAEPEAAPDPEPSALVAVAVQDPTAAEPPPAAERVRGSWLERLRDRR